MYIDTTEIDRLSRDEDSGRDSPPSTSSSEQSMADTGRL